MTTTTTGTNAMITCRFYTWQKRKTLEKNRSKYDGTTRP